MHADPWICVTGGETNLAHLAERLRLPADLHELRLDLLRAWNDGLLDLVRSLGPRSLVTCRPAWAGGGWRGDEAARAELLERILQAGPGWLDLELEALEGGLGARLAPALRASGARLVASHHATTDAPDVRALAARLDAVGADAVKLVVPTPDAASLEALQGLTWRTPLHVVLGVGAAAAWTRLRPATFGSAWTYVAADAATATAPDQPTWAGLARSRLVEHQALEPLALLGGPNVARSPGPATYSALFAHLGLPFHYLALPAASLADGLRVGGRLGVTRFSVTQPFKAAAAAAATRRCPWTRRTGVANTLRVGPAGSLEAWNTDALAFQAILDQATLVGHEALVLGGGATAVSAAVALAEAGATVHLAARDPARVEDRARAVATVHPWSARASVQVDLLVNTTPATDEGLWPATCAVGATTVLDLAFPAGGASVLVERARAEGAKTLDAATFWRAQGHAQLQALLDADVPAGLLAAEMSAPAPHVHRASHEPELRVPGSKSETQRALVLAALAHGPTTLEGASPSADSALLRAALERLGASVAGAGHVLHVVPGPLIAKDDAPLWCGDAGTCLRFLAALAPVTEGPLRLHGSRRLAERPLDGLLAALGGLGVTARHPGPGRLPLRLERTGEPAGLVRLPVHETSQFLSALLMVAARLPGGLEVEADGPPVSASYVDLTCALLARFGVPVTRGAAGASANTWRVAPGALSAQGPVAIGGDWSLAAFWRVAGRLRGRDVPLVGLDPASPQADRRIDDLLAALDGPGDVRLDLASTPDLLPPLAVAALFARAPVWLGGLAHARLKESDRLAVLADRLRAVGARVREEPDGLWLEPGAPLHGATLDPAGDHRMAMAFGVLGLRVPGVEVLDRGVVAKSYPAYWDHLETLRCAR
jgi:3-phosphoshikimate 1-carboxyvinyltransferase